MVYNDDRCRVGRISADLVDRLLKSLAAGGAFGRLMVRRRGGYGIYFNVSDRLMGANHPDYEARFAKVVSAPAPIEPTRSELCSNR